MTTVWKIDVRAINIYDYAGDGKLTGSEVSVFNNTQRTLSDDGKHTMQGAFEPGPDAKVDINVDTGEMSIKGAVGTDNLVGGVNVELNVENSEFKEISVTNSNLILDCVHDRSLFFETNTNVELKGNSIINQKDSQIDVNE